MRRQVREIGGGSNYRKWKDWNEGDIVEGELVRVSEDKYKKPNYQLHVKNCSFDQSLVGKKLTLNSSGSLDYKMEGVSVGETVYIEYKGQFEMEKGPFKGAMAHDIFCGVVTDEGNLQDEVDASSEL